MKRSFIWTISLAVLVCGCERTNQAASKTDSTQSEPSTKAAVRSGNIIKFDIDSPQLARIRVAPVESSSVPVEEVSAPGKVELNPSRVSHVTLPVAGRVREVLVGLGDAVRQGQTI